MSKITKDMKSELERDLRNVVQDVTTRTSMEAKHSAPMDKRVGHGGGIKSSIYKLIRGLTGEVWVGAHYAPYVDFGTGSQIQIPSDWKDVAIQFKGAGIREVNNKPQPFFYPSVDRHREKFKKASEKALDKVMGRIR